jgi:hypothetical protein
LRNSTLDELHFADLYAGGQIKEVAYKAKPTPVPVSSTGFGSGQGTAPPVVAAQAPTDVPIVFDKLIWPPDAPAPIPTCAKDFLPSEHSGLFARGKTDVRHRALRPTYVAERPHRDISALFEAKESPLPSIELLVFDTTMEFGVKETEAKGSEAKKTEAKDGRDFGYGPVIRTKTATGLKFERPEWGSVEYFGINDNTVEPRSTTKAIGKKAQARDTSNQIPDPLYGASRIVIGPQYVDYLRDRQSNAGNPLDSDARIVIKNVGPEAPNAQYMKLLGQWAEDHELLDWKYSKDNRTLDFIVRDFSRAPFRPP